MNPGGAGMPLDGAEAGQERPEGTFPVAEGAEGATEALRAAAHRALILARLGDVWEEMPSLRLGQLIGNAHSFERHQGADPYYLDDESFLGGIEQQGAPNVV